MRDLGVTALVDRARAGDPLAFDAAIERLGGRLLLYLRRAGAGVRGADCDAEDLLQQALVRAWNALASFRQGDGEAFYRWLVAIADGVIADRRKYLAAKGRGGVGHIESRGEKVEVPASGTSASKVAARAEERARVEQALAELDPTLRAVVEAHFLGGRSLAEIAADQGTGKTAAWERLHAAVARLRAALGAGP